MYLIINFLSILEKQFGNLNNDSRSRKRIETSWSATIIIRLQRIREEYQIRVSHGGVDGMRVSRPQLLEVSGCTNDMRVSRSMHKFGLELILGGQWVHERFVCVQVYARVRSRAMLLRPVGAFYAVAYVLFSLLFIFVLLNVDWSVEA